VPLLEQVLEHNPDTVKIVLKNMPLGFHKLAAPAALAALAASKQGKFWEYHDELFATPKLNNNSFDAIAKKLGLDLVKFQKDITSPSVQQQLAKDLNDAKEAGVTGTPTIFVNGVKLKKRDLPSFQKLIDEELAK
jgi:protein-disulfide isomerase